MGEYTNGVLWRTIAGPTTSYIAVSEQDLPTNAEITGSNAGGLYPTTLSLTRLDPVKAFTGGSLGAILDLISLNGTCVGSGQTVTAAGVIARKLATCDEPLGATPHYQVACSKGLFILNSIRDNFDQDATVSGSLFTFTDGSASPVAITDGVAWPSTIVEDRYRLGICKLANVQFPEIEDVQLDFNVSLTPASSHHSTIWTLTRGVLTVTPQVTLRGRDLSKVKTGLIELTGNGATAANSFLQFRKISDGSSYVSFASSSHTVIQVPGLAMPSNLMSATAGSRGTNEIVLTGKSITGAAAVIINTASTYNSNP